VCCGSGCRAAGEYAFGQFVVVFVVTVDFDEFDALNKFTGNGGFGDLSVIHDDDDAGAGELGEYGPGSSELLG
jgi:hypothetical protein